MASRIAHGTSAGSVVTETLTGASAGDVIQVLSHPGGAVIWYTYGTDPADPVALADDVGVCPAGGTDSSDPIAENLAGRVVKVKVLCASGTVYSVRAAGTVV
jgi:hypothetical protein